MKSRFTLALIVSTILLTSSGCVIIDTDSQTRVYGTEVTDETLSRIDVGSTPIAWLLATLGEPSQRTQVDESTEILKYSSKSIKSSEAEVLFLFDAKSKKEKTQTVFFEFQHGVLERYWLESTDFQKT